MGNGKRAFDVSQKMLQNLINQEVSLWTGARFSTFSLQVRCCFPPSLSLFGLQRVV